MLGLVVVAKAFLYACFTSLLMFYVFATSD